VRGTKGYGFSVHGHNPVYITNVVEGSIDHFHINYLNHYITITSCRPHTIHAGLPAAESDIRFGDIIVEVESTDVTRANGDLVVSIVRYSFTDCSIIKLSTMI
jgi:membrane-associated protease RseP (regulator of RpoE activity)